MSRCIFKTPDIIKTSEFYEKVMKFRAERYLDAQEPHIWLYRDSTEIMLLQSNGEEVIPNRKLYGYGYDAYFLTTDPKSMQKEFIKAGAIIVRQLFHTDNNELEFVVEDIDGRWICCGVKEDWK